MRLIEDGIITLDLDDVVKTNHISCQIKELSLIQFRSLEPAVLYDHRLPSPAMQDDSFQSASSINFLIEIDKTLAALEATPACLNRGKSLVYPMRHVSVWSQP